MARRSVQIAGQPVLIGDDEPQAPSLGWWALLRTRVIDEVTEAPPRSALRISSLTPGLVPRTGSDGLCGLVGRPCDVASALVTPGALRATVEVDGYLPLVLDTAIDQARRALTLGAVPGATKLTIAPAETAERRQFQPGRGVMLERPAPTDAEQFSLTDPPLVPPLPQEVPLTDAVAQAHLPGAHVAGVPMVLSDQRLHRAEPALLRGVALRQAAPGSAPVPAPAAHIGIRGVWWTQREVAAFSAPPHPARMVVSAAPLAFSHDTATPLAQAALTPDGVLRRLDRAAPVGAQVLAVHPWAALAPAGGDVLQLETDASSERELVISDGFDASVDPAMPAQLRLRTPLAFWHAGSAPVMACTVAATALGSTEREALAGDRVLFASSLAGLATDDVLRIGGLAPDAELRFVRCLPQHNGAVFAHEVAVQADGRFELPPISRVAQLQFFVEHLGHPPQLPFDFVPEPGSANTLQVLFTP